MLVAVVEVALVGDTFPFTFTALQQTLGLVCFGLVGLMGGVDDGGVVQGGGEVVRRCVEELLVVDGHRQSLVVERGVGRGRVRCLLVLSSVVFRLIVWEFELVVLYHRWQRLRLLRVYCFPLIIHFLGLLEFYCFNPRTSRSAIRRQ